MLGKGPAIASDTPGSGILVVQSLCSLDNIINMATVHNGWDLVYMDAIFEGSSIECIVLIAGQHLQQYQRALSMSSPTALLCTMTLVPQLSPQVALQEMFVRPITELTTADPHSSRYLSRAL